MYAFQKISDKRRWKDLLLHEIAHVIAGGNNAHNNVWEQTAKKLGCSEQHIQRNKEVLKTYYGHNYN